MRHATGRFWLMASTEPLFGLRKFREDVAALEAQGKSLWTEELAQHVRAKVVQALLRMRETYRRYSAFDDLVDAFDEVLVDAIDEVTFQLGIARKSTVGVRSKYQKQCTIDSFLDHITERDGIDTILFSFVEAVWQLTEPLETGSRPELSDNSPRHQLSRHIRATLEDHRVAFDFVRGRFVARGDQVMHSRVVLPALTLLSGRDQFGDAERRFLDALKSIQEGRFDDAITDSSAALEAVLGSLGCSGNTLGKKFQDAKGKGLVTSHDLKLADWISADRASKGDAHPEGASVARADAWLATHIVGAIIVRLAEQKSRE